MLRRLTTTSTSTARIPKITPLTTWLTFVLPSSILAIIHIGGLTRLTKSGLSMTDWKLTGEPFPQTNEEWNKEFGRYKQFPEYQQRQGMHLDEFKMIFYYEYGHRMMGRGIGVLYLVPAAIFAATKKIPKGYGPRVALIGVMGGTQGLVGWWMVKSGLGDDRRADKGEIRVKPTRLATHLGMALATYSVCLGTGLELMFAGDVTKKMQVSAQTFNTLQSITRKSGLLTALAFITAVSGAIVSGNDAGQAYNCWPYMDWEETETDKYKYKFIPDEYDGSSLASLTGNTGTVQFNHRMLAYGTVAGAVGLGLIARRAVQSGTVNQYRRITTGGQLMGVAAVGQASLGVATVLTHVPMSLAASHQMGSLAVLSAGVYTTSVGKAAMRSMARRL